jgi:hypothetical protein
MISVTIPKHTSDMNPMVLLSYCEAGIGGGAPTAAVWAIKLPPADRVESTCAFF